jgi:hypothetical protein
MSEIPRGAIRFNTDSNKPELWDGSQWAEFQLSTPNLGRGVDTQPGARGIFIGGLNNSPSPNTLRTEIDYINITSTGDAVDFGDITAGRLGGACSSRTRAIKMGGLESPGIVQDIDYITIASTGDAIAFGNLGTGVRSTSSVANATRGIVGGGVPTTSTMQYVTIASTGNSQTFGTLSSSRSQTMGAASPTRGFFAGGETPTRVNTIDFITISTLGNAEDFGDLSNVRSGLNAVSNATRLVFGMGEDGSVVGLNILEYITMATTGNATNFGDLTRAHRLGATAASPVRGVFAGGANDTPASNTTTDTIDYINILTEGNAVDFGNLTEGRWQLYNGCVSNAHGGL